MIAAARLDEPPKGLVAIDERDFATLAALIYEESGIVLTYAKLQLVQSRLGKHLRTRGLTRFADYLALLQSDDAERATAVESLTTNHTKFFREQHHFEHLVATVWPALRTRLDKGGRVRIWSAACSSGEEPYTLLMSILGSDRGAAARLAKQDFRLLGTDLSGKVLRTAQAGRYPVAALEGAPAQLRQTWTRTTGDIVEFDPAVRQLCSFRPLNFLDPWPMKGQFDVIFCRNAMIYFDEPTKGRLIERFAERLAPEAYLYIGHSERCIGPAAGQFQPVGQTIYRKGKA